MTESLPRKAKASPTKAFFVRMITRDITVEDSILDLIDNSVDGAWHQEGGGALTLTAGPDLTKYRISILVSPEQFVVTDNCGGMTLDDAADYAFSFGRRPSDHGDPYSIGVYGIGMKRAAFKLGKEIRIRSTYADTGGTRQAFVVPITVEDWLDSDDPPWDFEMDEDAFLPQDGVSIIIERLTDGAKASFGNAVFIENLRRTIARDYLLHLNRGLTISVNGRSVQAARVAFLAGAEFMPVRVAYEDELEKERVSVEIVGGMAEPPPDDPDPDEVSEREKKSGWYVVCNGRVVLAADKSTLSGWGTPDWPRWHPQYSGFIGMVFFTAENPASLPLTTTKRSVEISSEVFLHARPKMRDISKQWTAYTNVRKQARDEAKRREREAVAVSIHDVEKRASAKFPTLVRQTSERVTHVNYSVAVTKMTALKKGFRDLRLSNRDVGLKSFDYAYEDLVGEE